MQSSRISVVFCVVIVVLVGSLANIPGASAQTQTVNFTVNIPELGISGGFATIVNWDENVQVTKGDVATVSYSLSDSSGSLSITIPLSLITFGFMSDQTITIPLPTTPLGSITLPVLQYLTGIPSSLAGVNVILQASINAVQVSCSSGQSDVLTSVSTLSWTAWGSKAIQVQTHSESAMNTINTKIGYSLSIGVDATFLGFVLTLIGLTKLATVTGTPVLTTSVQASDPFPIIAVVAAGAIIGTSLIAAYLVIKSKKSSISRGGNNQVTDEGIGGCPNCHKSIQSDWTSCPYCEIRLK